VAAVAGSSFVVKGGYGIYRNLGVTESIGLLLAHRPRFDDLQHSQQPGHR
jgi:hypothetical protein